MIHRTDTGIKKNGPAKRLTAIILAAASALGLTACGSSPSGAHPIREQPPNPGMLWQNRMGMTQNRIRHLVQDTPRASSSFGLPRLLPGTTPGSRWGSIWRNS